MNHKATSFLSLIIAVGVFFAYVGPTWKGEITTTKAAIKSDDDALSAAKAYTEAQNQLTAARNAIDPNDLARLTSFIPDSVDNVRIILDINSLAARSGLTISNVTVSDSSTSRTKSSVSSNTQAGASTLAAPENPVGSVDLSLAAAGTYSSLRSFLDGVEKSGRLLDLRDLAVKGSNTGAYNYQMTLRIYWLR